MKKLILASVLGAAAISTGCSDSSSGSSSSSVALTGDAALPEQMSLVTAQDDSARSTAMWASSNISSRAVADTSALAADSDYSTSRQNTYVHLDAVQPISFIDSLLCFANQSRPLLQKDEGDYISWNDAGRCFDEKGGSGDTQGDNSNQTTSYVTFVANSSQASSSDPLIFKAWIEDYAGQAGEDGNGPNAIKMLGEVSKTPTDDNPYGVFALTYGLLPDISNAESANTGFGEVKSSETSNGGASFTLYQEDTRTEDFGFGEQTIKCITSAAVDYNDATESGLARTGNECSLEGSTDIQESFSSTYALAVNTDFVHMAQASTYANIDAGSYSNQVCLARDSFTNVAWSYSVFNKSDGSEVALNSGMQLKVDGSDAGDGSDADGFERWGHIGYWGAWREDGQAFTDGETVQEAKFDDTTGDNFTVKVSPGRLVKNTIKSLNLSDLDGVRFNTWIWEADTYLFSSAPDANNDADTTGFVNAVIEVNDTDNGFQVVAYKTFSESGETVTELANPVTLSLNTDVSMNIWSRQLGGDVRYIEGSSKIRMFERSFVNGGEIGAGELFAGGDITLKCFERCLKSGLDADDVSQSAAQSAVYKDGLSTSSILDYAFSKDDLTLKDSGDAAVAFIGGVTKENLQASQYWQWGVSTGPMVTTDKTAITTAQELYAAIEGDTLDEYYVWETGLESWQQQIRLIDGSSNVIAFDKPITIQYTHATANDRNDDTDQDGSVFLLEYGGKGQLWGLPFVQNGDRWNPVISLKDGAELGCDAGGNNCQYIVKARDIEQKMNDAPAGSCDNLPLTAPSQAVPTGITGAVFDIGDIPVLDDETPTIIDGEPTE